jgi:aldehyde dehydrogenase (NAD+)
LISINRHIIHEAVYDQYIEGLTAIADSIPTGSVKSPETIVGPIINEPQRDSILDYIERTREAGATIEAGGDVVEIDGVENSLVIAPTVLSDVTNDMPVACNEHFGPAAPVIKAESIDEAIAIANDTEYGLAGSVHAGSTGQAWTIAKRLDTGMVHINDQPVHEEPHVPFGGMGVSGIGWFGGEEVLHEFTQTKWISVQHEPRDYGF